MEENRNSDKIIAVNLKSVEVANILKCLVIPMHFEFFPPFYFDLICYVHAVPPLVTGRTFPSQKPRGPDLDSPKTPKQPTSESRWPPGNSAASPAELGRAPRLLRQLLRPNQEASAEDGESCPSVEEHHIQHCRKKANRIITDPRQPTGRLVQLLTSARQYRSIRTRTARVG